MSGLFFYPDSGRTQAWSCGGGVQSAGIAALIVLGRLPKPNIAFMVDTGREKARTFPYLHKYIRPALASVGIELAVIPKAQFSPVDLTSRNGKEILLPAYTTESGNIGKLPAFCSGEWKRDVGERWLRSQGVEDCDVWIGFSLDEMKRIGSDRRKWKRNVFPLVELRMRRKACEDVVAEIGWPPAPRSACWMCSNQSDAEWLLMKTDEPKDFAKAVVMDRWLRIEDPDLYIHASCKPLDEVDFEALADSGGTLFGACASGGCFT